MNTSSARFKTIDIVYIALFAVLIAVCSWISIPTAIPFTLQTFAVFCTVGLLGGRKGSLSILIYVLLGAIGLPVFHNFTGGIGILLGNTGGYIIGFLFIALVYWLVTSLFGNRMVISIIAMLIGLLVCYTFGSIWFMAVYSESKGAIGLVTVLGWCVLPYIIPDLVKLVIAIILIKRLSRYINHSNK